MHPFQWARATTSLGLGSVGDDTRFQQQDFLKSLHGREIAATGSRLGHSQHYRNLDPLPASLRRLRVATPRVFRLR